MKQQLFTNVQKRPYKKPALKAININPTRMLASSGTPGVQTTDSKVDTHFDALAKQENGFFSW